MPTEDRSVPSWGYLQPLLLHGETDGSSLLIPGSYGREALIRPHLDSCPCRKRSGRESNSLKNTQCARCKSVRSLASFIPRNDLLQFSFADVKNSNRVLLEVSGNNSMQIVRLHHQGVPSSTSNQGSNVAIHHGDEISLHWEGLGLAASVAGGGTEQPLVKFRVVQIEKVPSTKNQTSWNREIEKCQKIKSLGNNVQIDSDNLVPSDTGEPSVNMGHDESTSQIVMADRMDITTFRDRSEDYHEESPTQGESAPLTMPLHFNDISSRSCSYESKNTHEYDPVLGGQEDRDITSTQATPQKCNISVKRKFEDSHNHYKVKTDETSHEVSLTSLPISTLTYNELQQLQRESNDVSGKQPSSVRNAVLSLTLALTSNASAWDSTFLDACKNEDGKKEMRMERTGKWIPRLLQNTEVHMHKNKNYS